MYTLCFLRNVALSSCTFAASPRCTFCAARVACRELEAAPGGKTCAASGPGVIRWMSL
jgi:predicted metal-binding protein